MYCSNKFPLNWSKINFNLLIKCRKNCKPNFALNWVNYVPVICHFIFWSNCLNTVNINLIMSKRKRRSSIFLMIMIKILIRVICTCQMIMRDIRRENWHIRVILIKVIFATWRKWCYNWIMKICLSYGR